MSEVGSVRKPPTIEIPRRPRTHSNLIVLVGTALALIGFLALLEYEYAPIRGRREGEASLRLVSVDQGRILATLVENGVVESSNKTIVRCEVEALVGTIGGTAGGAAGGGAGRSGQTSTSAQAKGGAASAVAAATKSRSSTAKSATGAAGSATAKAGSAGGASKSATASSTETQASGTAGSAGSASAKPTIRSFAYQVTRHSPMRNSVGSSSSAQAKSKSQPPSDGGGRGRRGPSNVYDEKPGSTRIVWILPEGTEVKAGDLVCVLDSATFKDELQAQEIRYVQAKAYVEQVQAILEVNEITFREYRDGVLPQDKQLIRQYITTCRIQEEQAERTVAWSREVTQKGFRAPAQLRADELALQRATFALQEAEGMLVRLEKFTAPKILKSLEANLAAIRADKFAQQTAFDLEEKRLRDLERNIKNCELRAPHAGIIVYANQTNSWGRQTDVIEEGSVVREGQPIFSLPDPLHMRIKARINETKVHLVQTGQKAEILVDAYPGRKLKGVVAEINPISSPNGLISDVRVYHVNVDIVEGFPELRPGLSVEVLLHPETRSLATRVPVDSIRWVKNQSFVAVQEPTIRNSEHPGWNWRKVQLGLFGAQHVEVLKGVEQGDRIVANPLDLPAPRLEQPTAPAASGLAAASLGSSFQPGESSRR